MILLARLEGAAVTDGSTQTDDGTRLKQQYTSSTYANARRAWRLSAVECAVVPNEQPEVKRRSRSKKTAIFLTASYCVVKRN